MIQAGIVDQPILEEVEAFQRTGGKVIASSDTQVRNVDGEAWAGASEMIRIAPLTKRQEWAQDLMVQLKEYKGFEGQLDGLWLSRRGERFFVFNSSEKPAETTINGKLMRVAPHTIYSNATDHIRSN